MKSLFTQRLILYVSTSNKNQILEKTEEINTNSHIEAKNEASAKLSLLAQYEAIPYTAVKKFQYPINTESLKHTTNLPTLQFNSKNELSDFIEKTLNGEYNSIKKPDDNIKPKNNVFGYKNNENQDNKNDINTNNDTLNEEKLLDETENEEIASTRLITTENKPNYNNELQNKYRAQNLLRNMIIVRYLLSNRRHYQENDNYQQTIEFYLTKVQENCVQLNISFENILMYIKNDNKYFKSPLPEHLCWNLVKFGHNIPLPSEVREWARRCDWRIKENKEDKDCKLWIKTNNESKHGLEYKTQVAKPPRIRNTITTELLELSTKTSPNEFGINIYIKTKENNFKPIEKLHDEYNINNDEDTSSDSDKYIVIYDTDNKPQQVFRIPKQKIENGPKGRFHQITHQDSQSLILTANESKEHRSNPHESNSIEIYNILTNIGTNDYKRDDSWFALKFQIDDKRYITCNAGERNLEDVIHDRQNNGTPDKKQIQEQIDKNKIFIKEFLFTMRKLDALHDQGYAHLDLKPGNIVLNRDNEMTVIDWQTFANSSQKIELLISDPVYMPTCLKEAIMGANTDNERKSLLTTADQYAFVLTMMQILVGYEPHYDKTAYGALANNPIIAEEINPDKIKKIELFINKYIKPEFRGDMLDLIIDPLKYAYNRNNDLPPLREMFKTPRTTTANARQSITMP